MQLRRLLAAVLTVLSASLWSAAVTALPTGDTEGTLTEASGTLTFTGTIVANVNPMSLTGVGYPCQTGKVECDSYPLTINLGSAWLAVHPAAKVVITVTLDIDGDCLEAYLYDNTAGKTRASATEACANPQVIELPAAGLNGSYSLDIVPVLSFANGYTATVTLEGGKPLLADDDGDGVGNSADHCPGTPARTPVDSKGCALPDADHDGVADSVDKCPGTPAGTLVDANGCTLPDADHDGVADSLDKCPGTPPGKAVDAIGCYCPLDSGVAHEWDGSVGAAAPVKSLGDSEEHFTVPAHCSGTMTVEVTWALQADDLDLHVTPPGAATETTSDDGNLTGSPSEQVTLSGAASGDWKVRVSGFISHGTAYHGKATFEPSDAGTPAGTSAGSGDVVAIDVIDSNLNQVKASVPAPDLSARALSAGSFGWLALAPLLGAALRRRTINKKN